MVDLRGSIFTSSMSPSFSEQWHRRASVCEIGAGDNRKSNATGTIEEKFEKFFKNLRPLVAVNAIVFLFFTSNLFLAVLSCSVGYALKDITVHLARKSRNQSITSEILIYILRKAFPTTGFHEALRRGLCSVRAGKDFKPKSVEWPSDLLIQRMTRADMEGHLKTLLFYPKTRDCDPFVCFLGKSLAQRSPSYYDEIPLVNPISRDEDFIFPTISILDIDVPMGYLCSERGPTTRFGRLVFRISAYIALWLMDTLELFEETKNPLYFDSLEQAAVFFHYNIRPHIPQSSNRIACVNEVKDVQGNACAHAFAGVGVWRLKAVSGEGRTATWNNREASSKCEPPKGSVAVVDCSWQANMKVREGYLPYGAAAFFGENKELLGIWSEPEMRMIEPPKNAYVDDEPWRWAQYHWKSSIAYEVFSVGHLLEIHWSASNTLVQVARDLPLNHPVRRLIKPFTWGSAFINYQAMINLVQTNGAIVRTGAVTIDGIAAHFEHVMEEHVHYGSFEKFVNKMGEFPEGYVDEIPMVQDGKALWRIFDLFVEEYLELHYDDPNSIPSERGVIGLNPIEDDPYLQKFWQHARTARSDKYPLKIGKLSFDNLKEFLTWSFFWSTAAHNLVANFFPENTLPVSFAGRIGSSVRHKSPQSGFQVPINTWLTQTYVLANTTIENVPYLIETMRDTADFFGPNRRAIYGTDDEIRNIFVRFADNLDEFSQEIDAKNESRGWLATNSFNPKVMQCSASL